MSRPYRKLYRDTENKKVGGVCSGLARYFDVDPLLIRIAFVALSLMAGGALIAYVLLWWLVDAAPTNHFAGTPDHMPVTPVTARPKTRRRVWTDRANRSGTSGQRSRTSTREVSILGQIKP